MNASGSCCCMKFLNRIASIRLITVKIMYLSRPVNAPLPRQVVALRCNSLVMKSQIGFGFVHTTLKYLHKLILSITLSTSKDEIPIPNTENNAVSISNTKKLAQLINPFVMSKARPISKEVYFRSIIARISVPPLDAPTLNKMAEPVAGSTTAKQSSRRGSSVSGRDSGEIHSKVETARDNNILQ